MKKVFVVACSLMLVIFAAGGALADSIAGRVGVVGRLGFLVPADGEQVATGVVVDTDTSFIGGGGFIYGIDRNFAAEFDITHAEFTGKRVSGSKGGDFDITNITLGVQYRFVDLPIKKLVPYAGGGLDILINDFRFDDGERADVDTVLGAHLAAGVDYFIMKQLALTGEVKGFLAPDADVRERGAKVGNFDSSGVAVTAGVRYFFN